MKKITLLILLLLAFKSYAGEAENLVVELNELLMPKSMLEEAATTMTAQLAQQDPVFDRNRELIKQWYINVITSNRSRGQIT